MYVLIIFYFHILIWGFQIDHVLLVLLTFALSWSSQWPACVSEWFNSVTESSESLYSEPETEREMIYELIKSKNTHHWNTRLKYIKRAQKSELFSWVFHVCSAPGGFFHRDSLCIDTCFSAPSVYSVQTQTLYNTLLFTTVQNQQTPWISSAASSGFWQLLFQVTEEKDAHFWLFNVDLIWWNTYNVVVRSIQRSHCDSAWSCDCFWRTRRHYRV